MYDPQIRLGPVAGVLVAGILISVTITAAVVIPQITLSSALLILLLEVVVIALVSNLAITLVSAVAAVLAANWFLVTPQHTFIVESPTDLIELLVFLATATLASILVSATLAARDAARKSETESRTYREVIDTPPTSRVPEPPLRAILELLDLDEIELRDSGGRVVAAAHRLDDNATVATGPGDDRAFIEEELPDGYFLFGSGPRVVRGDHRLVTSLGTVAVRSRQTQQAVDSDSSNERRQYNPGHSVALDTLRARLSRLAETAQLLSQPSTVDRELALQLSADADAILDLMPALSGGDGPAGH